MAIVRKLEKATLERNARHSEVNCTYTIVSDDSGEKHLQVDTYGAAGRKFEGRKSQSIRFSKSAIEQLKKILEKL